MKNKFTRFLCFFLCFALCFAWLGPPQQVHATGIVPLLGVVIMFMIGTGIGIGINGTAHGLADGIEELVKEFETNYPVYQDKFWEFLASGLTIGPTGALLLNKDSTDLLNGFFNWLQSDKGWTEGSEVILRSEKAEFSAYLNGDVTCYTTDLTLIDGIHYSVNNLGTVLNVAPDDDCLYRLYYDPENTSTATCFYIATAKPTGFRWNKSSSNSLYVFCNGSSFSKTISTFVGDYGYSSDDVDGIVFINYGSSQFIGYGFLMNDGTVIDFSNGSTRLPTIDKTVVSSDCSISIPAELTFPDTYDWDDSTSLGLFTGHSGKIPTSVEEYNDLVLQDINSGVIPEVTTDVIVGTPDQVLPDEGDGTLAGMVSGILAQVMALPQNIANLILDGVKSIFIPDPSNIEAAFYSLLGEIKDKYNFDLDLASLFGEAVAPDDIKGSLKIFTYSSGDSHLGLSLDDVTFVSWYYLKKGVVYFRPYIRGFIVLMLIFYNLKQFLSIFGLGGILNGSSGDAQANAYYGRLIDDYMANYKE